MKLPLVACLALGACTSAEPPRAAPPALPWCASVPELTAQPSPTDGRADEKRVTRVIEAYASKIIVECPGVTGITLTRPAFLDRPSAPVPSDGAVIEVYVRERNLLPPVSPLYLDGVRVYFAVRAFVLI